MHEGELVVEVYVDVLLLVNFSMDLLILWGTGKMTGLTRSKTRLLLGATCGSLYSLVIFLPEGSLAASFLAKVACSLLMVWLAFYPLSPGKYVRVLLCFYGLSFAMGGAVLAAFFLADTRPAILQAWNGVALFWGLDYGWLAVGVAVVILLAFGGFSYLKKNWLQQSLLSKLTIIVNKRQVVIPALLDTGNQLIDPVSQKPVIVVEVGAISALMPETFLKEISREPLERAVFYSSLTFLDEKWSSRISFIPFNSVGKTDGLMIGFRPDMVVIQRGAQSIATENVVLGLANRVLSKEGHYAALLPPQILQDSRMKVGEVKSGGTENKHPRTMEY